MTAETKCIRQKTGSCTGCLEGIEKYGDTMTTGVSSTEAIKAVRRSVCPPGESPQLGQLIIEIKAPYMGG